MSLLICSFDKKIFDKKFLSNVLVVNENLIVQIVGFVFGFRVFQVILKISEGGNGKILNGVILQ